jgi:hypothetical protein
MGTSLGRHCDTLVKSDGSVLDIDYVVTSLLSSNVHSLRHNYFHLNRCALPVLLCRLWTLPLAALPH